MTESFNNRFRLHPESQVSDTEGSVVLTADMTRQGRQSARVNEHDRRSSHGWRSMACVPEQGQTTCLVRNSQPADTLQQVFQSIDAGMTFCVIPASMNSADIEGSVETATLDAASAPVGGDAYADGNGAAIDTAGLPQFQCLSSGTSGVARRMQRSHQSWICSFRVNASQLRISAQDSYAIVGSLSHSLPLYAALEACHLGADVQLLSELRPDRQLDAIDNLGTTVLYVTPTQARQLCQAASTGTRQVRGVRHVLCGGGKLDGRTRLVLQDLFSTASITEFYGASETSFITMTTARTPPGSVGRAYPGVVLKIYDDNHEETCGPGEIWVRSDYLFSGYVQGSWRDTRLLEGFLSIGELGKLDENGNLFLCGRKSRLANVADTTVFLEEIECVLLQHAAVHHCVVVSQKDRMRGETLLAVIEGCDDDLLRKQLLKHARQQLGPILAPRDILFVETLPVLAAGKPDIQQIQSMVDSS